MNRERADRLLKKLASDADKDAEDCRRRCNSHGAMMFEQHAHDIRELQSKLAFLFQDEERLDWIGTLDRFNFQAPPTGQGDVRKAIDGIRDLWRKKYAE